MSGMVLALAALAGYGTFLGATFVWRSLRSRRATGDWGWRKPVSRVDAVAEAACLTGCTLSLLAPLAAATGLARPVVTAWPAARGVAGAAGTAGAVSLAVWAQRHLAGQWRAGIEASTDLVTAGPFSRVRHPFYAACLLAAGAVVVLVPSLPAMAGLAAQAAAAQVIVRRVEEPLLLSAHGAAYRRYMSGTGRFWPRRLQPGGPDGPGGPPRPSKYR